MTVDRAIVILKDVLKSGWCIQPGAISEAIYELEEESAFGNTEAEIFLNLSSQMSHMAIRISELEEWRAKIENNICEGCLENVP